MSEKQGSNQLELEVTFHAILRAIESCTLGAYVCVTCLETLYNSWRNFHKCSSHVMIIAERERCVIQSACAAKSSFAILQAQYMPDKVRI